MGRFIPLVVFLLLWAWPADSKIDFDSYCMGWCRARYQDGIYRKDKCFCGDYYPVHLGSRFAMPKHPREPDGESAFYDGVDQMHYAPVDPDPSSF